MLNTSEINGYDVIGAVHNADGAVIIGERYRRAFDADTVLEYVVAFLPYGADEWVSGTYFDGGTTKENRHDARTAFLNRVSDSIWS